MKFKVAKYFVVILLLLNSCSHRADLEKEQVNKAIIDSEANELIETEQLRIVETLLNLDETLYELDLTLNGEAGKFTESFADKNNQLKDVIQNLSNLKEDLYDQADDLEIIRLQTIEPIVQDAMDKYEASKKDANWTEGN